MKRPIFQVAQKDQPPVILVVDKEGLLGSFFVEQLPEAGRIVFVAGKSTIQRIKVVQVPFREKVPTIPDLNYSHLFIFYHGEPAVFDLLDHFIAKARLDKAHLFLCVSYKVVTPHLLTILENTNRYVSLVVLGDIFGNSMAVSGTTIGTFLKDANDEGKITVPGEGLVVTYPVFINDVVEELLKVGFGSEQSAKLLYLFPQHAPTELSLARMLQKINPLLRILFSQDKRTVHEDIPFQKMSRFQAQFLLPSNYALLKKIKESGMLSQDEKERAREQKKQQPVVLHENTQIKKRPIFQYTFLLIAFIFLLPAFISLGFLGSGIAGLYLAKNSLLSGDFSSAKQRASLAQISFQLAQIAEGVAAQELGLFNHAQVISSLQKKTTAGYDGASALLFITDASDRYTRIAVGKSTTPKEDFLYATNSMKKSLTILEKMDAEKTFPELSDIKPFIKLMGSTVDTFPALFGFEGEKTYAVLFQNNMELRPGGGFIGSYGILRMAYGKVKDFTIHDVYDADGQLRGHIEPPFPLRRYLPTAHWFLRDANFFPDFPKSASFSANLLQKETGVVVDGVIGVDVSFVKLLVSVLGPLNIVDYKRVVTVDNFYEITQAHVEKNFFPGSTQKKDFLRSVFFALQEKVFSAKSLPYLSLAKVIAQATFEKHLIIAFSDPQLQRLFAVNGFSSSFFDNRMDGPTIVNDFLGISEANLGVNKANAYLQRKVEQVVTIGDDGFLRNSITLRYKNESTKWPGGDYKNYLQIIVPKGSVLSEILIDGQAQQIFPAVTDFTVYEKKDFIPPSGLEVETVEDLGKTIFGFLLVVPQGNYKTLRITYTLPKQLRTPEKITYDLIYFKQPGTETYPYSFTIQAPKEIQIFKSPPFFSRKGESAWWETFISQDQNLRVTFSRR